MTSIYGNIGKCNFVAIFPLKTYPRTIMVFVNRFQLKITSNYVIVLIRTIFIISKSFNIY